MIPKSDIDKIIFRYLSNQADFEDINILREWLKADPVNKEVFENIFKYWNTSRFVVDAKDKNEAYTGLLKKINFPGKPKNIASFRKEQKREVGRYLRVAAVIAFLLALAISIHFISGTQAVDDVVAMVKNENPGGQKSTIRLPDGSTVWLNAKSSISYPETFSDTIRRVKLSGEAFFDVVTNPDKPFIVDVDGLNVTVLGTKFNIKAYPEDVRTNVSLVSGKVKIGKPATETGAASYFLLPGEDLEYNRREGTAQKKRFDVSSVTSWKDGVLVFANDSFNSFKKKLELWYGVEVLVVGQPTSDFIVTGKFKNENMENVLRALQFGRDFKFDIDRKVLTLKFNAMKN